MRSGAGATARKLRRASLAALLCAGLFFVVPAAALTSNDDTKVQTIVNSGTLHPALELTDMTSPVTVNTMPLVLTGTVSSLTQIQVYIDDAFSVTIPLGEDVVDFSYSLVMSQGTHEIKLVGISPFADISPTVTLTVTYTPQSEPDTPGVPTTTTGSESSGQGGGAIISRDGSGSTTYSAPIPETSLPTWLHDGLQALDITGSSGDDSQIVGMLQRMAVVSSGLLLLVFARPARYALWAIRYRWFGVRECRLPKHLGHHQLLHFRVIGLLLVLGVFSFS